MTVAEFQDALLKLSPKDGDVVFYDLNAINSDWFDSDGFRASMESLPGAPRFLLFPVSIPRGASFDEAIRLGPQWLKCDGRTLTVDGVRVSRELFKFWHDDANAGKLFRLVTAGEVPTLSFGPFKPAVEATAKAEQIIRKIGDAAVELIITRNNLLVDDGSDTDEPNVAAIKEDLFAVLMGHDTGCLDPEDLDEETCELLWVERRLLEFLGQ